MSRIAGLTAVLSAIAIVLCGCVRSEETGVSPIVGCVQDSDCLYGYTCQGGGCQQSSRTCRTSADCLLDETCRPNPTPGCAKPDSGLDCPAPRLCLPPNVGFCCACETDTDCAKGGYCLELYLGNRCSASCDPPGCRAEPCCPTGSTCGEIEGPDGGSLRTCLPNGGACPTSGLKCG